VTDEITTQPIPYLEMQAIDVNTGMVIADGSTDWDGKYRLAVPAGNYKIKACPSRSNMEYFDEYYSNVYDSSEATIVPVNTDTYGIDLILSQYHNTQIGEDVAVNDAYNDASIVFGTISGEGSTQVIVSDEEPAPTSGFQFLGRYYDIVTEATYPEGIAITITIWYDDTVEDAESLCLYHWNGMIWEDVTLLTVDTENNEITGIVSSLSWFAIGTPLFEVTWLPPLAINEVYLAQDGSTVPVKFQLTDVNGNLVNDVSVIVTVTDSEGTEVLSGPATYESDIPGYKINAQTKEWELGEYTIQLSVSKDATYGLILLEKGQAKGKQ
jgi:hypothetical protein